MATGGPLIDDVDANSESPSEVDRLRDSYQRTSRDLQRLEIELQELMLHSSQTNLVTDSSGLDGRSVSPERGGGRDWVRSREAISQRDRSSLGAPPSSHRVSFVDDLDDSMSLSAPPAQKPAILPDVYNGTTNFNDWYTQFEMCRSINNWTEVDATQFLAVRLKGAALRVYSDLPTFDKVRLRRIVQALRDRFEPERDLGVYWAQLRSRYRKKGESLSDLASSIQHVARKAYPTADDTTRNDIEVQHFIDALDNREIQKQLRRNKPTCLSQAVRMALDEESFSKLDSTYLARSKVESLVGEEEFTEPTTRTSTDRIRVLENKLKEMEARLEAAGGSNSHTNAKKPNTGRGNPRGGLGPRCYRCSEYGHVQAECYLNL